MSNKKKKSNQFCTMESEEESENIDIEEFYRISMQLQRNPNQGTRQLMPCLEISVWKKRGHDHRKGRISIFRISKCKIEVSRQPLG